MAFALCSKIQTTWPIMVVPVNNASTNQLVNTVTFSHSLPLPLSLHLYFCMWGQASVLWLAVHFSNGSANFRSTYLSLKPYLSGHCNHLFYTSGAWLGYSGYSLWYYRDIVGRGGVCILYFWMQDGILCSAPHSAVLEDEFAFLGHSTMHQSLSLSCFLCI
jgi:hypothetical protein